MCLIDLDQQVIVPIVDEMQGGVEYEQQMTLAELFVKFLPDFKPIIVDAVPVEWLEEHEGESINDSDGNSYGLRRLTVTEAVSIWQKEQEAR